MTAPFSAAGKESLNSTNNSSSSFSSLMNNAAHPMRGWEVCSNKLTPAGPGLPVHPQEKSRDGPTAQELCLHTQLCWGG